MTSQPTLDEAQVRALLAQIPDPETGRDLVAMRQVRGVHIAGRQLNLSLALTTHSAPLWDETREFVVDRLRSGLPQAEQVSVEIDELDRPPLPLGQIGLTAKSVIAVGSGKGGVGKSTIAVALAYSLSRAGCKVGLMDADVYGPSVPHLVGIAERPSIDEQKKLVPPERGGVKVISMGLLVPQSEPVVWRGPMLHGAVTQLLRDTQWGPLDYLVIDMPPGTGDIAITLSQLLPLTGAVVVCTPQDVALLDAIKAIAMFRKVNIPILGMVENMSGFVCPGCGKRYDIFGSGGARSKAEELEIPFLGEVPINISIRSQGDAGQMPDVFSDAVCNQALSGLGYRLVKNLAIQAAQKPPLPSLPVL